ncbi:MAG: exo-alpha-sialidase [Bacteroides sp.]|nr:exo-alpha-sialidase [Bacteroides sp.]
MKSLSKAFFAAALLPLTAAAAVVPAPTDDPITITVDYSTGTLAGSGNFRRTWTSNDDKTGLVIDLGFNNMANLTSGPLQIYSGQAQTCTIALSMGDGWYVSNYSFTASTTATGTKTISHNGSQSTVEPGTNATVNEKLDQETPVSLTLSGPNNAVVFNNFTITLSPMSPEAPTLKVDEAPAADANCLMVPTNIVNGHFNTFTTWYHLMDGKNYLTGATLADAGSNSEQAFADEYLFCAVKSGSSYVVYNKAAGVAAPVAGASVNTTSLTVNGADVTPVFAEKFAAVKVSEGVMKRTDGSTNNSAWQGQWISNAEPTVTLSGSLNNMTCTENATNSAARAGDFQLETGSNGSNGNFTWTFGAAAGNAIYAYTFLARTNGEYTQTTTVTPNGGSATTLSTYNHRIQASGFDDTRMASFVQNSLNGKGLILSDCYVTVRRSLIPANTRTGIKLFPHQGVERRIPAIARVYEGDHAGRLVAIFDYRHNGGDIGFNGNISLQIVTSDDNGATWTEPDYLRDAAGNAVSTFPEELRVGNGTALSSFKDDPNKNWNIAFGDAALVADRESGRLLLMAVGGPVSFWEGRYDKPNQCVRWYSEDGGQTWSEAQRVTYDLLDLFNGEPEYGKIDSHFIGSGRIMQSRYIKVGEYYRVYAVIASQNDGQGGSTRNWVLYSDDFGQKWNVLGGTDVCPVMTGRGDECKAEELPDGSVLIAGRCRTGNRNFNIFRYTDATNARGKWMDAVLTDMGFGSINACDGEIMILPVRDNNDGQQIYLALQSFPYGGGRNYVSIAYKALRSGSDIASPSSFTSFDGRYRVSSGASVYSTMAWQANNKLAFFWEEGSAISGTYLDFTLEEITDGRYSFREDAANAKAIEMTRELLELRAENDAFGSQYVGQPIRSKEFFLEACDEYDAAPSYRTYVKANKLQYEGNGLMQVLDGATYRITSAHDGTYASITEPQYLASDGSTLTTTDDGSADNTLFIARSAATSRSANGQFMFVNKEHNKFIGNTPSTVETLIPMTDSADEAGKYTVSSRESGHSVLASAEPGHASYPALHMSSSKRVVIWTSSANASRWYMEMVDAPDGYELPEPSVPELDNYDFDYATNLPKPDGTDTITNIEAATEGTRYFDLQGRPVATPRRGIFITADGKKILL